MLQSALSLGKKPLKIARAKMFKLLSTPIVVIIYHRVTTLPMDPQMLTVTPDNFRAQLKVLKDSYPILRFEDDWSKVKEPSVVITFDDGYADNYLEALPILEAEGVPATFFISTGYIGRSIEYWWDDLEQIILSNRQYPATFELVDPQNGKTWSTKSYEERLKFYTEMIPLVKLADFETRLRWLEQLRAWSGCTDICRQQYRAMDVEELKKLAQSPFATIGAHTVTHTRLSSQSVERQKWEITQSKAALENLLKQEVKVFSYPYGSKNDFTTDSRQIAKESGFSKAAANWAGQWHWWTDPYQIPRQLVRNWDEIEFSKQLKRFWT